MPDGRFLSKSIAYSAQLASVSFEADYVFMRLVPFPDREGRLPGESLAIKGMCCPLRNEMTPDVIERALGELALAGLIVWYRVGSAQFIQLPGFAKHQRGARLDREAPSRLPGPDAEGAEEIRTTPDNSGNVRQTPPKSAKRRVSKGKGSKGKRSEAKGSEEAPTADASAASPVPKKARTTWITPFAEAWEDMYGGTMPIEPSLRPLKSAVDKLGSDEAQRRWENYLASTQAQFASGARFASTLNEWETPGKDAKPRIVIPVETIHRAEQLLALGQQYNLLEFDGNKTAYGAAKSRAAADPRAGATLDADLRATRIWEGIGGLDPHRAVREIARRLELAKNGQNGHAPEATKAAS